MITHSLIALPILLKTISSIIHKIIIGLVNNEPVHIGIDGLYIIKDLQPYAQASQGFWESHLSAYQIVYGSAGISSMVIKLGNKNTFDIYEEGTYLYNCQAGSFEIEIDTNGRLSEIVAEFDGKTPSVIPQLLYCFPEEAFPSLKKLKDEITHCEIVDDKLFLSELQPRPYLPIIID